MTWRPATESSGLSNPSSLISPNFFDAVAFPDLIRPLVLSHLLSPSLWEMSAKLEGHAAERGTLAEGGIAPALREAQRAIDAAFEHLSTARVLETSGDVDLEAERERLGAAPIGYAIEQVRRTIEHRVRQGTLLPTDVLMDCLDRGKFPAYFYANIDVVRAKSRLLGRRAHRPKGVTSCLDEVTIFSALAMTLPEHTVESVIVLASPAHYTAFGWDADGRPWWFYQKSHLVSADGWRTWVAHQYGGDGQAALDDQVPFLDRIITSQGTFDFHSGVCSIPAGRLVQCTHRLEAFFGRLPASLAAALERPLVHEPESAFSPVFGQLVGVHSIAQVRARLVELGDEAATRVLLAHRSLEVADLAPYLPVARRGPLLRAAKAAISSVEDAIRRVAEVAGCESVYGDRGRIAMPDETLRFNTGTDRDKALLLHVLLEGVGEPGETRGGVQTRFTEAESFVCGPFGCIRLPGLERTAVPENGIVGMLKD